MQEIIVEIADGRLGALRDSLQNNEMMRLNNNNQQYYESPEIDYPDEPYVDPVPEERAGNHRKLYLSNRYYGR